MKKTNQTVLIWMFCLALLCLGLTPTSWAAEAGSDTATFQQSPEDMPDEDYQEPSEEPISEPDDSYIPQDEETDQE